MGKKRILAVVFLLGLFLFRLAFGLLNKFWGQDELQVYLIGLKYYTTGLFPYWGPDVVYTGSRVPGALLGLVVGLPLRWWPQPESPFVLLNILSFLALAFLAWYLSKRIPGVPRWFIWAWLMLSPWTLNYSTHVENLSYALIGAVLFFVGVLELFPIYQTKVIGHKTAFFLVGLGLFWVFQLQLSWVLMLPYILLAFCFAARNRRQLVVALLLFLTGAACGLGTLVPTLIEFGGLSTGGTEKNILFNPANLLYFPVVLVRFVSLSCFEMTRFIGTDTPSRVAFVMRHAWIIPFAAFLLFGGVAQVLWYVWSFFATNDVPEWRRVKAFVGATVFLIWISFLFSIKEPASHTFYIMLPVSMWYSFYCVRRVAASRFGKPLLVFFIASGVLFHVALTLDRFGRESLYRDRDRVVRAITTKDHTLVGARREAGVAPGTGRSK
jgi:hypothetical protein